MQFIKLFMNFNLFEEFYENNDNWCLWNVRF